MICGPKLKRKFRTRLKKRLGEIILSQKGNYFKSHHDLQFLIQEKQKAFFFHVIHLGLDLPHHAEKFENAALFLGLGLPSTLIRRKNRAFENALQTGGI